MLNIFIERYRRILVLAFFIFYLFIGMAIFDDYGISWDEHLSRRNGAVALSYIFGNEELLTYSDRYHGTAFEMVLVIFEKVLNPFKNMRATYLIRHFLTFLLFYISVIFFYKLCKYILKSWRLGLLGALFLILSPRIFAHSFYNSKDIPFLSVFIIAVYALVNFLDRKTIKSAFLHALSCAFLIDIRLIGIVLPFMTFVLFSMELVIAKKGGLSVNRPIKILIIYILLLIAFTILFWPILWNAPVYNFLNGFRHMSRYPWNGDILFLGKYINAKGIPWFYIPVWIAISTPLSYIASFIIGCFASISALSKPSRNFYVDKRYVLILMLWLFLPLFNVIVMRSILYDEWRHLFFIYPALLIVSLIGLVYLFRYIKVRFQGVKYRIISLILIFIIVSDLSASAYFMVKNHPYQNVYFNALAGIKREDIKNNFELDYWGLSYRQALEYILKNDARGAIKIHAANSPGESNANILANSDRQRILFVSDLNEADYFLSNYRCHKEEYPYKDEYYSITVDGLKIMVVYRLRA